MRIIILVVCIVLANVISAYNSNAESYQEPMCLSRFDYDYKMMTKLVTMETELARLREALKSKSQSQQEIRKLLEEKTDDLKLSLKTLKDDMGKRAHTVIGSTYTRWGRTSCPGNGSDLIYSGYAAGSSYTDTGASSEYICLPKDPLWSKYDDAVHGDSAMVHGAEYELNQRDLSYFFGRNIHNDDVPCAVCSTQRSRVIMIPGRNQCYGGWTREYHGYLTAGYNNFVSATEFVCLDAEPESISNSRSDKNGKLFYFVEARCGSLPCPPYVNGRELACVVCSM